MVQTQIPLKPFGHVTLTWDRDGDFTAVKDGRFIGRFPPSATWDDLERALRAPPR